MQSREIVLIGIGEIGSVFARGFLRLGHSVHPVTRKTDMQALSRRIEVPALVVAVGETSLQSVLAEIPRAWKRRLCLLQNELLADAVAVLKLQESLAGTRFDREAMIARVREVFSGDPEHKCRGRSALERLTRTLGHAAQFGLELPTLRGIADNVKEAG